MNGHPLAQNGESSDYPLRHSPVSARNGKNGKGKQRATEEEQASSGESDADEGQENQLKSIEENLRRMSLLEKNRRASKRKNSPSVSVQPPLADLSRKLSRRGSNSTRSRKSSVDSNGSYVRHSTKDSLTGLADVLEEAGKEDGFEEQPTSPPLQQGESSPPLSRLKETESVARAAKTGSKFVEDLDEGILEYSATRPGLDSLPSSYSLRSLMTDRSSAGLAMGSGLYAQPLAQDSTTEILRHDSSYSAGYKTRSVEMSWVDYVLCCGCFGLSEEDEHQSGATMPS